MTGANDRTGDVWGTRHPYARDERWPQRVDMYLKNGVEPADVDRWVGSACLLCSNGCGLDIAEHELAFGPASGGDRARRFRPLGVELAGT